VAGFEVSLSVVLVLATILALSPLAACLYAGAVLRTAHAYGCGTRRRAGGHRQPISRCPATKHTARTAIQGAG